MNKKLDRWLTARATARQQASPQQISASGGDSPYEHLDEYLALLLTEAKLQVPANGE